mmetsp:Transcript_74166/g.191326  ORF Transcript_74166/g.191326 Transcript_74166/m.191326 type:complete len:447 (+) Transcript_74166:1105-2445(+)
MSLSFTRGSMTDSSGSSMSTRMCGNSMDAFSRMAIRGGRRSLMVFSVARMRDCEPCSKEYRFRSSSTRRPLRDGTIGVFRSMSMNPGAEASSRPELSYWCILSWMALMICWSLPLPRETSGKIKRSVEGASPTSCSTSCQYLGWDVYWSQAMTHHLVGSMPLRGSRIFGTRRPRSSKCSTSGLARRASRSSAESCAVSALGAPRSIFAKPSELRARLTTLRSSMASATWPTPPGTGETKQCFASSAQTSPTMRRMPPALTRFIPASTTTAPSFSHAPRTKPGLPTQATTMSARRTWSSTFLVWVWHTVTVQSSCCSISATGVPTVLERPKTTASFPTSDTPDCNRISMIAVATDGVVSGSARRRHSRPPFQGLKPCTSFSGMTAPKTCCSSRCTGSGSCTSTPCTAHSCFSCSRTQISSPCGTCSEKRRTRLRMPQRSATRASSCP